MPASQEFEVGTMCTCLFAGVAYDAKIQEIQYDSRRKPYFVIHFKGWNHRYNESLPCDQAKGRLFPGCAEDYVAVHGGKLDYRIRRTQQTEAKGGEPAEMSGDEETNQPSTSTARKIKKASPKQPSKKKTLNFGIPKNLREALFADEAKMEDNYLLRLPATYTIDRIVTDYIKTIPITNEQMMNMDDLLIEYDQGNQAKVSNVALICTARGLHDYFNVVLGFQLLYKNERDQYNQLAKKQGFRATAYYGFIHLIRMMSRLGELFDLTEWNDHLINRIMVGVHDFLVFLNKNIAVYYGDSADYVACDC